MTSDTGSWLRLDLFFSPWESITTGSEGGFKQGSAGVTLAPIDFRPMEAWLAIGTSRNTHNSRVFACSFRAQDQVHGAVPTPGARLTAIKEKRKKRAAILRPDA